MKIYISWGLPPKEETYDF